MPEQDARDFIEDLDRLTSYDAAYLEVALRRNLPLATFDTDLIVACNSLGVPVL